MLSSGIIKLFLLLLLLINPLIAVEKKPAEFNDSSIIEKLGSEAFADITLVNSYGEEVLLSSYLEKGPVLLNFAYFTCPRLCHLIVDGMVNGLNSVNKNVLKDLQIISISFDHRDTLETTKLFRDKHRSSLNNINDNNFSWDFLYGSQEDIKLLADSVGFRYYFNTKSNQYAHSSALIFLSPKGIVSRYLYGITFDSFDLSMSISESRKNKVLSTVESILLFCYNYDPDEQGYVLEAVKLMKFAGTLTVFLILYLIFKLNRQSNYK